FQTGRARILVSGGTDVPSEAPDAVLGVLLSSLSLRDDGGESLDRRAPGSGPLAEKFAQLHPRFVKLRLGVPHGAVSEPGYFVMFIPFHIVQDEYRSITRRKLVNGSVQRDAIDRSGQALVLQAMLVDAKFAVPDCAFRELVAW